MSSATTCPRCSSEMTHQSLVGFLLCPVCLAHAACRTESCGGCAEAGHAAWLRERAKHPRARWYAYARPRRGAPSTRLVDLDRDLELEVAVAHEGGWLTANTELHVDGEVVHVHGACPTCGGSGHSARGFGCATCQGTGEVDGMCRAAQLGEVLAAGAASVASMRAAVAQEGAA